MDELEFPDEDELLKIAFEDVIRARQSISLLWRIKQIKCPMGNGALCDIMDNMMVIEYKLKMLVHKHDSRGPPQNTQ